jgi:hypothetical protein
MSAALRHVIRALRLFVTCHDRDIRRGGRLGRHQMGVRKLTENEPAHQQKKYNTAIKKGTAHRCRVAFRRLKAQPQASSDLHWTVGKSRANSRHGDAQRRDYDLFIQNDA